MNKRLLVIVITMFLLLISKLVMAEQKWVVIPEDSALYKQLLPMAAKWQEALMKKDFDTLVTYAFDEYKDGILASLKDKKSDLYRYFYTDKVSAYSHFKKAKSFRIIIFRDQSSYGNQEWVNIFYYDETKCSLKTPLSDKMIRNILSYKDVNVITNEIFTFDEGHWHTTYSINPED
jgi:hypothetical protein